MHQLTETGMGEKQNVGNILSSQKMMCQATADQENNKCEQDFLKQQKLLFDLHKTKSTKIRAVYVQQKKISLCVYKNILLHVNLLLTEQLRYMKMGTNHLQKCLTPKGKAMNCIKIDLPQQYSIIIKQLIKAQKGLRDRDLFACTNQKLAFVYQTCGQMAILPDSIMLHLAAARTMLTHVQMLT